MTFRKYIAHKKSIIKTQSKHSKFLQEFSSKFLFSSTFIEVILDFHRMKENIQTEQRFIQNDQKIQDSRHYAIYHEVEFHPTCNSQSNS